MKLPGRDQRNLVATVTLAVWVPLGAAAYVGQRTRKLGHELGAAAGVPSRIGAVDADLTGTIRLSDVSIGDLVHADAIEASVAMSSLLDGSLGADELHVTAPRIAIEVDRDGDSDLARLARRLATNGNRGSGTGSARVRRIVVDSGSLTAHIEGVGEVTADAVELIPDAAGVRVVTGPVRVHGHGGLVDVELAFQRSAAELALPRMRFGRVLAVAGTGTIDSASPFGDGAHRAPIVLGDVAIGRLAAGGPLQLRASIDDGGSPRPVAAELSPHELALTVTGDRVPLRAFAQLVPHGIDLDSARATGSLSIKRTDAAIESSGSAGARSDAQRRGDTIESSGSAGARSDAQRRGDTIDVAIDGTLAGARIDHRAIAEGSITMALGVHGSITVSPDSISVPGVSLELGAAHWTASGWLRRGTPPSGQLDLALASAPCDALIASLPAELRGPLDGLAMTGSLGGRVHLAIDLAAPVGDGVELTDALDGACGVAAEPPAADVTTLAGVVEQAFPDGTRAKLGRGAPGWVELVHVPPHVGAAFVAAEDARFWDHHGFDLFQIARSLEIDLREHRLVRGGSTISQQLVKNAFLSQRRSLDRKIQEAILTWRLESRLDKRQILERYLNIIELGPRIFGIGNAAKYWFGESASNLTVRQSAFLAAMTAEPTSMSRRVRRGGGLDVDSGTRVNVILGAMLRDGLIDLEQFRRAENASLDLVGSALKAEP